jgi:phosphate transport system permease protein
MTIDVLPSRTSTPGAELAAAPRDVIKRGIVRRYAAERRFKVYGIAAIVFSLVFLLVLFASIISRGYTSFVQSAFHLTVFLDPEVFGPEGQRQEETLLMADYMALAADALVKALDVDPSDRRDTRAVAAMLSHGVDSQIRHVVLRDPALIGKKVDLWLLAHDNIDALIKGSFDRSIAESLRKLSDRQIAWLDKARATGLLQLRFNTGLFAFGASSQPETSGIGVALTGSLFMMLIVVVLALPLGVAAAAYLQEFAPKNRLTDLIEVNINNLAAVPSIVFGILGLEIFINLAGLPRSAAIVGGLVLTLMTLPTIIIATRAAIGAVPPSIREAAIGVGASEMQTLFHHVLPLAFPGMLTGTIIGLAKALGETAPLLMIGMVAFVVEYPKTPLDPATALPVQVYMWATAAQRGFVERTSGATLVLLLFLVCMNLVAVILRRKLERRW